MLTESQKYGAEQAALLPNRVARGVALPSPHTTEHAGPH